MTRRHLPALLVTLLTVALAVLTSQQALDRYHDLRSGWSWDLAYYNQWFWALTQGDGQLSVRPVSSYGDEGPSVWKMNYLAPIRFLIVPLYELWPDPRLLLLIQNTLFWLVVPASYTLLRAESGSSRLALSAAVLVPLTPVFWPLVWNDFRELQLAVPFLLWVLQGWRGRNVRLTVLAGAMLLACRQEFAIVIATLAIVPPREPEDVGRTYTWSQTALVVGAAWFCFGFFGYLSWASGHSIPQQYVNQFRGPRAPLGETLITASDFLFVGLGSWAVLAAFRPRVALLGLPWVYMLAGGKWSLRLLAEEQWHHVRYVAPMAGLFLAAGLLGYARIAGWLAGRSWRRSGLIGLWVATLLGFIPGNVVVQERLSRAPTPILPEDVAAYWRVVETIPGEDGALAAYEVTAPLSSRKHLYSYVLLVNRPPRFPILPADVRWLFLLRSDLKRAELDPDLFEKQGFEPIHRGDSLWIFRRGIEESTRFGENRSD